MFDAAFRFVASSQEGSGSAVVGWVLASMSYLCIVAKGDVPVFEANLGKRKADDKEEGQTTPVTNQFLAHAALDSVEAKVWTTTNM